MRVISFFALLLLSIVACAQDDNPKATPTYMAGKHYEELPEPVRTTTGDKIEVMEVFWYGCPHCYHIEPLLKAWKKTLPENVEVARSPGMWADSMKTHARMFYTAKSLGILDDVHMKIFDAMIKDKKRLLKEDEIAKLFAEWGVEEEKFKKVFNSFSVSSQVQQADSRQRGYKITGTPEIIVDGRFRVSSRMAGSQEDMLKVAKYLVDKVAAERAGS